MDTNLITVLFSLFLITTVKSSELMGGHYDNVNENYQREETSHNKYNNTNQDHSSETATEELIPDPSALIIPGYNLPGHLFNDGKPFYVEKDPKTGAIDFNNKSPAAKEYSNEYDYIDEEPSTNIFDKANIDRKDGGYGSHRPNDVNQLTPNFHDFLNLPVKYSNPEKYVYPLISSSYANTKIQGNNVNSYNHKQYAATTYKPTVSPTYYTTSKSVYYNKPTASENNYVRPSTTEAPVPLTTEKAPTDNLLNSGMNHPSYYLTTEYDYDYFTTQNIMDQEMHSTTEAPRKEVYSKPPSTTKKPYSIFDELFGDYEDPEPIEQPSKPIPPPPLFSKLPATNYESKYHNKQNDKIIQVTPSPTRPSTSASPTTTTPTPTTTTTTTTRKPTTTQPSNKRPADNNYYNPNYETVQQVYPEEENTMYEYDDDYNNNNNNYNDNVSEESPEPVRNMTNISTEKSVSINIRNETNTKPTTKTTTTERIYHSSAKPFSNSHQYNIPPSSSSTNIPYSTIKGITTRYSDRFSSLPTFTTEKPDNNFISITSEQYDDYHKPDYKTTRMPEKSTMNTQSISTTKVTSMPLGENHPPPNLKLPVITLTQNLKESLNREKVDTTTKTYLKPVQQYEKKENFQSQGTVMHPIPSTSNIRIPADQDIVSFVVGNHQNVDGGHYIGSAMKEESYVSNSFRPLYSQQNSIPVFDQVVYNQPMKASINYGPQPTLNKNLSFHEGSSTTINVQPIMGAQASLSIGMPADEVKKVKGEVVDEKLDLNENIEYPKEPGSKVVFPDEDLTTFIPPSKHMIAPSNMPNRDRDREILSLYSKPMMHQLPADLTPPSEPEAKPIRPPGGNRPPWDPRPGHFYQGRPEYARPPRPPHKPEVYKRIDGLPNILPQFRPNAKVSNGHYMDQVGTINAGYMPRQPLLDRPSNRPIGFFEKLHPPPPPKRIHDLRKVTALEPDMKHNSYRYEERILNIPPNVKAQGPPEHFGGYQMPPKVPVANRKSEDESEIATLQMIQAKQTDKLDIIKPNVPPPFKINYQEATEKPLYVVYPVNSVPLKLDVLDNDKKETVVVGTRGEHLPLPPSKITQDPIPYEQKPLLKPKDRNDTPLLKPHTRPNNNFPIKTDFPYTLERPDPTFMNIPVSSVTPELGPSVMNNLDTTLPTIQYNNLNKHHDIPINYQSNNQWTSLETESRIVNGGGNKINYVNDQISATLKTFTDKPIAIAYTPTEPNNNYQINTDADKYSVPNFGRPVIPEIRPDSNSQNVHPYGSVSNDDSEFTVSAIMHTHPQIKLKNQNEIKYFNPDQRTASPLISNSNNNNNNNIRRQENLENHKLNLDVDSGHIPAQLDFQAPFHASVSIDSEYQGWSVVNQNQNQMQSKKSEIDRADVDELSPTNQPESSSEFDIENFKPQLFGGFKPIYNVANEQEKVISPTPERQE